MLSEINFTMDLDLYNQVSDVCTTHGTTLEKVVEDFMTWCAQNPEEAKKYISYLVRQYGPETNGGKET